MKEMKIKKNIIVHFYVLNEKWQELIAHSNHTHTHG